MLEKIKAITTTYHEAKDSIQTEEATKNALIMPFIASLGYNVFNPLEVVPEIVADMGDKKGEKIDYAIKRGDETLMLIECKKCSAPLTAYNISQVYRYFGACKVKTGVRLAVLTNGLEYLFFSDLAADNVLDQTPFFSFNILNVDDAQASELQRFAKAQFNIESILAKASEMKKKAAVEKLLGKYLTEPTENFVRCILTDLDIPGMKTQQLIATYSPIIKDAFGQFFKNRVGDILRNALRQNQGGIEGVENIIATSSLTPTSEPPAEEAATEAPNDGIITTQEEIEAYVIIKSIAREIIPAGRVHMRDAKSYCAILLDNKNYKPIVRLFFNNLANLRLNICAGPQDKKGEMIPLAKLDDIYQHADKIKNCIKAYEEMPDYNPHKDGRTNNGGDSPGDTSEPAVE